MKLLHIACLAGLLWLSGCATQNGAPGTPPGTDGSVPTTPAPSTEVTHTPQFPSGPLLPIAPARASRLEVIARATHMAPAENPADFNASLQRHLAAR